MDSNELLLSICIPTNGAVQWILPVLDSIFEQNVDQTKFEVVITDNGKDSELEKYIEKYPYDNLRYYKTDDEGFLNLVTSLKKGNGLYCKMLNHRSVLIPGSINNWLEMVEEFKEDQPIIYCTDGQLSFGDIKVCSNLDQFVKNMSYLTSWSAGIGFWKKDIPGITGISLNAMFPNSSLLFEIRQKSEYVIWNKKYQNMLDDSGKGGYNYFETFGVVYLDILNDLRIRNRISKSTFISVKHDLYAFLCRAYYKEVYHKSKHNYILDNVEENIVYYYGKSQFKWMKFMCIIRDLKRPFNPLINFLKKH